MAKTAIYFKLKHLSLKLFLPCYSVRLGKPGLALSADRVPCIMVLYCLGFCAAKGRERAYEAWVADGAPGVFAIDGKINPNLEADWHAEHFPKNAHWIFQPGDRAGNVG